MAEIPQRSAARDIVNIFDLETGGLEDHHPDIQIAAVAVDISLPGWPVVEEFERKLGFDSDSCESEALELNHFDPEVWEDEAVSVNEAKRDFSAFLKRNSTLQLVSAAGNTYTTAKIGGHNVSRFDLPRLERWWGEAYKPFAFWRALDTITLAAWVFDMEIYPGPNIGKPENFKLETLCAFFGIEIEGAHDALEDVKATKRLAAALHYITRGGAVQWLRSTKSS